jgi:hypothetical protein
LNDLLIPKVEYGEAGVKSGRTEEADVVKDDDR